MNIWLKELSLDDDKTYYDLLCELSNYKDSYAKPVSGSITYEEFEDFKKARIRMSNNDNLPEFVLPTTTYWVINEKTPIGYATLKHKVSLDKPGGHIGLCLKKEYQNMGIGKIVSEKLSEIAYNEFGIEELIYSCKKENEQSKKSIIKNGGEFIKENDGYLFYKVRIDERFNGKGRN